MLYVALVVNLAIPIYYTVQIGSLPWVSARRIVTFPLVAIFALAFSSSREVRQRISLVFRHNRLLAVLVLGYLVSAVLSLFTAVNPIASLNEVVLAVFEWYSFFMICVYVFRSEKDIDLFVRIVMWCAVVISLVGLGDFIFHKHLYLDILPKPMINSLLESNPAVQQMLDAFNASRSGMIRETSVFNTAIPFSEFEAMIAMLAVVFFLDGRRWTDRLFGVIIFILCFFGIFVSGSRAGYVALLGAGAAFTIATFLRALRQQWGSIRPALLGVTAVASFVMVIGAVMSFRSTQPGAWRRSGSSDNKVVMWNGNWRPRKSCQTQSPGTASGGAARRRVCSVRHLHGDHRQLCHFGPGRNWCLGLRDILRERSLRKLVRIPALCLGPVVDGRARRGPRKLFHCTSYCFTSLLAERNLYDDVFDDRLRHDTQYSSSEGGGE